MEKSPLVKSIEDRFEQLEKAILEAFKNVCTRFENDNKDDIKMQSRVLGIETSILELARKVDAQDKLIKELQDSRADGILLKDPVG